MRLEQNVANPDSLMISNTLTQLQATSGPVSQVMTFDSSGGLTPHCSLVEAQRSWFSHRRTQEILPAESHHLLFQVGCVIVGAFERKE